MTAGNQPSSSGNKSAFDICEMIISEEFHLDEENPPSPAIQSYGYAARDRIRAAKREVCVGGAQRQPGPVQDTYLVGGPPDIKAMSGSVESDRVIQLHFRRKATDDDRKWLLEAINQKLATDSAVTPSPGRSFNEILKHVRAPNRPASERLDRIEAICVAALAALSTDQRCPECEANGLCARHAVTSTSRYTCQDQHRRGYCTESGCPYAVSSTQSKTAED